MGGGGLDTHNRVKPTLLVKVELGFDNFDNSKLLDDHLSECEIFMCSNSGCNEYFETMAEMKEHINNKHRSNSPAHYSFCYWILNSKDKSEKEIYKKLKTIYPKDW